MKQLNLKNSQIYLRNKFLRSGVKMVGPETIFFSNDTQIGKNVMLSANSTIIGNIKIGDNVRIGAGSVVLNDIPDNSTAVGVPAKIINN